MRKCTIAIKVADPYISVFNQIPCKKAMNWTLSWAVLTSIYNLRSGYSCNLDLEPQVRLL